MIDVIKATAGKKLIIAENLGHIDEKVNSLLDYSRFPGMSVFQFGFDGNNGNPHLPHNYKNNLVAYTGTHDNNTLLGFVWELDNYTRSTVLDYVGYCNDDWNKCYDSIIKIMYMSSCGILLLPIQDILGYGADTRMNTPGSSESNWAYRVADEQLANINRAYFLKLNILFGRKE
jgi:4-alpha-glucanotransferase